jgi:ring-1,2-phenylacetyl-CoA epoxidase subunit PaaE
MSDAGTIARKTLRVTKIITETADTKSFVLEAVDGTALEYKAGQFLTFIFYKVNGDEVRRSYSISSSPDLGEPLTITVKRIINGEFSRLLVDRFTIGNELQTIGASGFFVLPEDPERFRRFIFLAAGSGITPVFALIKTLLHVHPSVHVLLIYSNTTRSRGIFVDQLQDLQHQYADRLHIDFLFSRSADAFSSRLTPESLEMFMAMHKVSYTHSIFYVCGPAEYMRMITYRLTTLGVTAKQIKKEIFHIQHPKVKPEPPDTNVHTVTLIRKGERRKFSVQYPLTILQAARLLHIAIPYSCENGQCGSCVVKCLQGEVWMAANEVLLEEEIRNGMVLTCTGYPVNGDVTISI